MIDVLGHGFALMRLYWAREQPGLMRLICYETHLRHRIDRSTGRSEPQRATNGVTAASWMRRLLCCA
jgi:hypothetical protein